MDEPLHLLTSASKKTLVALLSSPRSPDSLASDLGMTRQAVDKHLKDLLYYGLVEKIWVTSGKRPRVEFKLSTLGNYFYRSIDDFLSNFRKTGREDLVARLKVLDVMLIKGEVDQNRYTEMKEDMEKSMEWFLD